MRVKSGGDGTPYLKATLPLLDWSSLGYGRRENRGENKLCGFPESPGCFERELSPGPTTPFTGTDRTTQTSWDPLQVSRSPRRTDRQGEREVNLHVWSHFPRVGNFQGVKWRTRSSTPGDLLAVLCENQSHKGQTSSSTFPPTTTAGAIFNLVSLLGSFLLDIPVWVIHSCPLTQGVAGHT